MMLDFLYRVLVLFRKEVRVILKDKQSRFILIVPVIMQSILFGYVATYDLNKVHYALLDEDKTALSRELVMRFEGSGIFERVLTLDNAARIASVMDGEQALLVLHIGSRFSHALTGGAAANGKDASVQVIVDGRNGNVAGIAAEYAATIIDGFNRARAGEQGVSLPGARVVARSWYNPNLETRWNVVSGLIAAMSMIQVLMITALSVAREKEQGTFEQLLVTPLGPLAIMLGKSLPSVAIGLVQSAIVLLVALFWFNIPFAGSYALFFGGLLLFNFAVVGIGLAVSALTATMQQAMLYAFSLIMPMILLSGLMTPVSSMPRGMELATRLNPPRYGIELAQRIYLEGATLADVANDIWPLVLISIVTLSFATWLFRRHLS